MRLVRWFFQDGISISFLRSDTFKMRESCQIKVPNLSFPDETFKMRVSKSDFQDKTFKMRLSICEFQDWVSKTRL